MRNLRKGLAKNYKTITILGAFGFIMSYMLIFYLFTQPVEVCAFPSCQGICWNVCENMNLGECLACSSHGCQWQFEEGICVGVCRCRLASDEDCADCSGCSVVTTTTTVPRIILNVSLYLNGTQDDVFYENETYGNFTVDVNVTGLSANLTTNLTDWTDQTGITPLTNISQVSCSANDTWYNITGYYEGDATYYPDSQTYYAICWFDIYNFVTVNGTSFIKWVNKPEGIKIIGWSSDTSETTYMYKNLTLMQNGTGIIINESSTDDWAIGVHNISINSTKNSTLESVIFTVVEPTYSQAVPVSYEDFYGSDYLIRVNSSDNTYANLTEDTDVWMYVNFSSDLFNGCNSTIDLKDASISVEHNESGGTDFTLEIEMNAWNGTGWILLDTPTACEDVDCNYTFNLYDAGIKTADWLNGIAIRWNITRSGGGGDQTWVDLFALNYSHVEDNDCDYCINSLPYTLQEGKKHCMKKDLSVLGATGINNSGSVRNNWILDCEGNTASGNYPWYGVEISKTSINSTIKNCIFRDFYYGIKLLGEGSDWIQNFTIKNNTFINNTDGIFGGAYRYSIFTNNTFLNNTSYGFYAIQVQYNNYSFNYFENTNQGILFWLGTSNFNHIHNNTLVNMTLYAIRLNSGTAARYNEVYFNTISSSGTGIAIYTDANKVYQNTIYNSTTGLKLASGAARNNLTDNSIFDNTVDLEIYSDKTNYFRLLNFTDERIIKFIATSDYFNYNNATTGGIWLNTTVSATDMITRLLSIWSQTEMKWNDTGTVTETNDISGLLSNKQYEILIDGLWNKTSKTDSTGKLPQFSVSLDGETEIKVRLIPKPPKRIKCWEELCYKNHFHNFPKVSRIVACELLDYYPYFLIFDDTKDILWEIVCSTKK